MAAYTSRGKPHLLGRLRYPHPGPCFSAILFITLLSVSFSANATQVEELIRHIDQLWRGQTSQASMTMLVKTRRYERNMTMEAWSRGKNFSLVVIRDPVKDRGIATLKVATNIWNYLPKINRVTKIPSSMMSGAWMGSHFTNDDLIKESTFEDDYTSSITFEGVREGRSIYEITSLPKADAAVIWGKVVMLIEQTTLAPYKAHYFDEENILIRTIRFDQFQLIDDRTIPMRMTLQPEEKPDESTVLIYNDITFEVPLEESFFSLQNLRQRR
ncbi:MAG: outer membrane lipoprotein-sorting protein [Amphritea sp.]